MKNRGSFISLTVLLLFTFSNSVSAEQKKEDKQNALQEEREDYYKKWLKEDVVHIITPEEEAVFHSLTTPEEKEQFIEQFWYRRDPDLRTATNEFKEEHYRRIAYANERFHSGWPGWMTDRGRIYIIHGPPAEIESHPSGGVHQRPTHEGGGETSTYPFEIWRYRYIEGIRTNVVLEFVDPTLSGEYRLALNPEEKDALLHVPGAGLTLAEQLGMATKADRPYFSPGNRDAYPLMSQRAQDNPFERYETYARVQRPQQIKYGDLQELVKVNVRYNSLSFKLRQDQFKLNENQNLVPITLELQNKDLTFKKESGVYVARVAVYGIITSITHRIVKEFEYDLTSSYHPEYLKQGLLGQSMYQTVIPLDRKTRYKLELVVKDINSGNVGIIRQGIIPHSYDEEKFTASSLILSDFIRRLGEIPKDDQMFVLGDVWIRPSLNNVFSAQDPLGIYLQIYNAQIDQTSLSPSLRVAYQILRDGETMREVLDESGESMQFYSRQRVVLIKQVSLRGLEPGNYTIRVEVQDRIKKESISAKDRFEIVAPTQIAARQSEPWP